MRPFGEIQTIGLPGSGHLGVNGVVGLGFRVY